MKVKSAELAALRTKQIAANHGNCGLCHQPIKNPCADHDHSTGLIRDTICRTCNSGLGAIERLRRYGVSNPIDFARQAAQYLEEHQRRPSDLVHPAYRTPIERKALVKKRRIRRAKLRSTGSS